MAMIEKFDDVLAFAGRPIRGLTLALFLLDAAGSSAQSVPVPVPFIAEDVALPSLTTELSYTVDMSTLPQRPRLTIEAIPDAAHADMELELSIESCNLTEPNPFLNCNYPIDSTPNAGTQSVSFATYSCAVASVYPAYVGETCLVKVRALSFGSAGAPATIDVVFSGVTEVPSSTTTAEITTNIQPLSIIPSRDTTFYQSNTGASNGLGVSFWTSIGTGSNALHAALDFNVFDNLPPGATIVDARIRLDVLATSGSPVFDLFAIPRNGQIAWVEGTADAPGDESTPPAALGNAATWSHRRWFSAGPAGAWVTPGGDRATPAIARVNVTQSGTLFLQSQALLDHVRALATDSSNWDGFLLVPVSGAARFASDENPNTAIRPRLLLDYSDSPQGVDDFLETTTSFYVNEGQNFRWIYDTDDDRILVTPVVEGRYGRCTWSPPGGFLINMPYTYQYLGSPSAQGLDCCTWQIGSTTGVTGTGQAIFFINVDSNNPANQPPDTDGDGIKDLCDNCPNKANGPLKGTCLSGSRITQICHSNQDCLGAPCSLAQDDANRTVPGDACSLPEPATGSLLVSGLVALGALARRRARSGPLARSDRMGFRASC